MLMTTELFPQKTLHSPLIIIILIALNLKQSPTIFSVASFRVRNSELKIEVSTMVKAVLTDSLNTTVD